MKILVTGRGKGGSWAIRGDQLGHALGATIDPAAENVKGHDLAIVVKRPRPELLQRLHKAKIPIVWDVLDAYPQPEALEWTREACLDWLVGELETIRPVAVIAATKAMAEDLRQCTEQPVLALPHHARPGQEMNPLRETVRTVGYQGGDYLGPWQHVIARQCVNRGWALRTDFSKTADMHLAAVDIVVAMRGQRGYAARNWKSGVKLANAQGSGTPSVVSRDAGYVETAGSRQYFADDEQGLADAFDALTSRERRKEQVAKYRPLTLESVASDYKDWLSRL